jgi:hypothetical protein
MRGHMRLDFNQIIQSHLQGTVASTRAAECLLDNLRTFIQETLRRSRTSYSTLQVALYYLIKVKPHVPTKPPARYCS